MNFKELEEKKNDLITRAEETLNKAKEEKRELTDDEAAELAEIRDNVRKIIDTLKLDDDFQKLGDQMEKKPDDTPTEPQKGEEKLDEKRELEQRTLGERQAFENYIRGRVVNERAGELTKKDNGAVIPTTIANQIIKKVYDICPILEQSTKYNVKGNLQIPYYDESSSKLTVAYQDEFTALTSSNGKFTSITLTGYLAGTLSKISVSLVNNSQFDIVNFVVNEMADAIKRFIEHELLIGTPEKVTGLSTLTNKVETAAPTAITADEIIDLHDAIKDNFQNGAIWIMSSKTRTALRKLKDAEGRYMLNDDISSPFGTTLLGKPVYCSDNMPEIGAGNTAIYYGNMKGLATKFNEEINVQVLREKFADEHAVGVIGWFEFDSKVQDAQQIAKLVCKAG
jgi:HK97 family phage major capsid protein